MTSSKTPRTPIKLEVNLLIAEQHIMPRAVARDRGTASERREIWARGTAHGRSDTIAGLNTST